MRGSSMGACPGPAEQPRSAHMAIHYPQWHSHDCHSCWVTGKNEVSGWSGVSDNSSVYADSCGVLIMLLCISYSTPIGLLVTFHMMPAMGVSTGPAIPAPTTSPSTCVSPLFSSRWQRGDWRRSLSQSPTPPLSMASMAVVLVNILRLQP